MTIEFKKWQKIQQFHNIKKRISDVVDYKRTVGEGFEYPVITYRGKIKLDGTNAAIRVVDGVVAAQSRSRIVTPEDDNHGFAKFVDSIKEDVTFAFPKGDVTIFGEWCGKGIQKRCSVAQCAPMFVVFAMEFNKEDGIARLVSPFGTDQFLSHMLKPHMKVLPYYGETIEVDYASQESIDNAINTMCTAVAEVEECDPWVKEVFGHEGLGEGIVYYPQSIKRGCLPKDEDLMFKAKGEKHKNVTQLKPVISDPEKVASVDAFVSKFVTDNRLAQGLTELGLTAPSVKDTGIFLKWLGNDVRSESIDELDVSGLVWKDVSKGVSSAAKKWFFEQV